MNFLNTYLVFTINFLFSYWLFYFYDQISYILQVFFIFYSWTIAIVVSFDLFHTSYSILTPIITF